jgi:hypothetical protein
MSRRAATSCLHALRSGCRVRREQRVCELLDLVAPREQGAPRVGDRFDAVVRAGKLAVDGSGRIGVVTDVDGEQCAVRKSSLRSNAQSAASSERTT